MSTKDVLFNDDDAFMHAEAAYRHQGGELEFDQSEENLFTDDFEETMNNHQAAREAFGGLPYDDLHLAGHRDQLEAQTQAAAAPYQSINPASVDQAVMGNSVTVVPDPNGLQTNPIQIVFWSGIEREACPCTITIQPQQPNVGPSTTNITRPFARLVWGTRSGTFTTDIDVSNGTQVTLEASSVYVQVGLDAGSNVPVTIQASLGFYTTSRTQPATRTIYMDAAPVGGTVVVIRPPFSTSIVGLMRVDTAAPYTLEFLDTPNFIGKQIINANSYLTSPIVLPNDCTIIYVKQGSTGIDTARLIFGMF